MVALNASSSLEEVMRFALKALAAKLGICGNRLAHVAVRNRYEQELISSGGGLHLLCLGLDVAGDWFEPRSKLRVWSAPRGFSNSDWSLIGGLEA